MPASPTGPRDTAADAADPALNPGKTARSEPDQPLSGRSAGVATGRPTEDDRLGERRHDGWNSNT